MKSNERGFTYIDVLIAVTILLVGVLALSAAVTGAVIRAREGERQLIAKQYISTTLESVFSARDIERLTWNAIGNVGSNVVEGQARGAFLAGVQPILPEPGTDGIVGTTDDTGTPVVGFQRQITITDYDDPERRIADGFEVRMRQIDLIIFYQVGNLVRQERASTMITSYAVEQ
jgi:type II secretory pathway pseudopilin PulG